MCILDDICVMTRIIASKRYNFICRKQRKNETLEQFHADFVELESRTDCVDRENEWVRNVPTAHMLNEKIAEELLAETKSPQDASEHAIRREKGIEHSKARRTNPFGTITSTTATFKQEPMGYIQPRRRVGSSG